MLLSLHIVFNIFTLYILWNGDLTTNGSHGTKKVVIDNKTLNRIRLPCYHDKLLIIWIYPNREGTKIVMPLYKNMTIYLYFYSIKCSCLYKPYYCLYLDLDLAPKQLKMILKLLTGTYFLKIHEGPQWK